MTSRLKRDRHHLLPDSTQLGHALVFSGGDGRRRFIVAYVSGRAGDASGASFLQDDLGQPSGRAYACSIAAAASLVRLASLHLRADELSQ